jgi:hypothetical protein
MRFILLPFHVLIIFGNTNSCNQLSNHRKQEAAMIVLRDHQLTCTSYFKWEKRNLIGVYDLYHSRNVVRRLHFRSFHYIPMSNCNVEPTD